ncbi:MAG: protein-glutamate O-methyltransferase CheR [Bryobacteraceae bacterium]|nr:protein-glutamate O-methyltransferase CheR [Bryobacteraceae bacterium]
MSISTIPNPSAAGGAAALEPGNYRFLQDYVYRESGIVLDHDKHYLIEARLMPIVTREKLGSLNDLCALLRAVNSSTVKQQVVDSMTTNETLFFREMAQYDALRTEVIPRLVEQRQGLRRMTFWSAASSTGQEAYSLAIMLLEMGLGAWNIQILGTDLSTKVLDRARSGRFPQIEVNRGLPVQYLVKYFTRVGLDWQLKDEVRRMVRFESFDLRQSMRAMGPFDVVFCRNVMIYFDAATKKKILADIRGTLFGGGYLLLGGSETTLGLDEVYQRTAIGKTVFYRCP